MPPATRHWLDRCPLNVRNFLIKLVNYDVPTLPLGNSEQDVLGKRMLS